MNSLGRVLCVGAVVGISALASPITYFTHLSGANENPPVPSPATGFALVTIDTTAHTLAIDASFSGLIGTTTAAHIHCCVDPPGNVGVATQTPSFIGFPLGVSAGAFSNVFDTTLASTFNASFVTANGGTPAGAEAALATGLAAGQAYFNIHTAFRQGGEIRGFLQPVPEPATVALVGVALAGLAVLRRSRRI